MKFVDEFRDADLARRLIQRIRATATRSWTIMEVCGGQTHSLLRHGIDGELAGVVELIHGPGCPVCVTPQTAIDQAVALSLRPGVVVASFGDMLRVPGSRSSLLDARAAGGRVQPVYSPLDAVQLARESPRLQVVFLAVGFETTAPATALAILQARQLQLVNFTLLVTHVRVLPAMELLAADPTTRVAGFLAAGHVCTVMGYDAYQAFVARYGRPVVVTGFEPTDLLSGILDCVTLLEQGTAQVTNRYTRSVQSQGNQAAQRVIEQVYEVCDQEWRGFGVIPGGGWRLREDCRTWDALHRWPDLRDLQPAAAADPSVACPAAEVLAGRLKPTACPHFGTRCVPESPLGAPMVSAEGACSAYYRYGGQRTP